jgi:signal transduction histidine kinase/DNA-binding NarL/FixJ family response regulator
MSSPTELLERRLARERSARLEAECLLERKARELYDTNVELQKLIIELDQVVADRTAEALRARDEAIAANHAKSAFLANMSHEIRTPLASIIGFAELLLDERRSPVARSDALRTIMSNGQHLLQIISDILDVSKIEAEGLEIEEAEVPLAQALHETESLIGPRARDKGLQFAIEPVLPLPAQLRTDPTRLKQILLNFCSNAIKFTERGAVTLQVACEGAPRRLRLTVADTGIGMTEEQIARLFRPFTQADVSTTRQYGGTGLGLYICSQLATRLGGELQVHSEPGRGSRFSLLLALGEAVLAGPWLTHLDELERAPDTARLAQDLVPQLQGQVLLAEDGSHNQRLIRAYVEATGAQLTIVGNGELAVEQALAGDFDLVLMDIQMPVMDGVAATSLLREAGFRGPIVALTANVMRSDRDRYRRIGCNEVLAKPIDRARLYAAMAQHLSAAGAADAGAAAQGRGATNDALASMDRVIAQLTADFEADLPGQLQQMQEALDGGDWPALGRQVHILKGIAQTLGHPELTRLAAPVDRLLAQGRPADAIEPCRALMVALRRGLPAGAPPPLTDSITNFTVQEGP